MDFVEIFEKNYKKNPQKYLRFQKFSEIKKNIVSIIFAKFTYSKFVKNFPTLQTFHREGHFMKIFGIIIPWSVFRVFPAVQKFCHQTKGVKQIQATPKSLGSSLPSTLARLRLTLKLRRREVMQILRFVFSFWGSLINSFFRNPLCTIPEQLFGGNYILNYGFPVVVVVLRGMVGQVARASGGRESVKALKMRFFIS